MLAHAEEEFELRVDEDSRQSMLDAYRTFW